MRFQPGFIGHTGEVGTLILDLFPNSLTAYSFRKLRSGYSGSAVRLRESGGDTEQDIGFDADGNFDKSAAATFLGANNGFVVTWYDQSGNGDNLTRATTNRQPQYNSSGLNNLPCMKFTVATQQSMQTATGGVTLNSADVTVSAVTAMSSVTETYGRLVGFVVSSDDVDYDNAASGGLLLRQGANEGIACYADSAERGTQSLTYNEPCVATSVFEGTFNKIYVNGVAGTSAGFANTFGSSNGGTLLLSRYSPLSTQPLGEVAWWQGACSEVILWGEDQTANVAAIEGDQYEYFIWTPADITGLAAWYDAASTGLYSDAGVTPITSGSLVYQWNDMSGNAANALQASSSSRPTFHSTGLNNLPGVYFDGNGLMRASSVSFSGGLECTAIAVGRIDSGPWKRIVSYTAGGAANDYDNAGSACLVMSYDTNQALVAYRNGSPLSTAPITFGTPFRGGTVWTGSSVTTYTNNVAYGTAASTLTFAASGRFNVGANIVADGQLVGAISEIVVYAGTLTSTELQRLDDYFVNKWGF